MPPAPDVDPALIRRTHDALFATWFPMADLPIPIKILPKIEKIAAEVRDAMFTTFSGSSLMVLLTAMTYPGLLPFYACLGDSVDPAAKAFVAAKGGYGGLSVEQGVQLFSFLFEGSCGPVSVMYASILREAYLTGIWDLPLAGALIGIVPPPTFTPDPDVYAAMHMPELPPSRLVYDRESNSIRHLDGTIDCLVIGSGPGGATVAHQLREAGKRVVLIEKGPWVVWGSMNTMSYPSLMFKNNTAATVDNAVIIRSGEAMGGGSTVNIDLAFSPLEATIQDRVNKWRAEGLIDSQYYTQEKIAAAYQWVREIIQTRRLSESELNPDNEVLWDGAQSLGVDPSLYHLNRYAMGHSPSPVTDKRDAAVQLLVPAATAAVNPLSIIPDASVTEVLFQPGPGADDLRAVGVALRMNEPWQSYGNTIVDPNKLGLSAGATPRIYADSVILSAGTIGTTRILLQTAKGNKAIANPRIGRGLIVHPSFPMVGVFEKPINLLEGLDSATFVDAFGVSPGFIYETMGGLPAYGAVLIPGSGKQVAENILNFEISAGFGAMLVDTPSDDNRITLDDHDEPVLTYHLSESDKARFRIGVALGIRMMFLAGASKVIIPSSENVLDLPRFDPMNCTYLTTAAQADRVEKNLHFVPNRTLLTAAHIQAANKIGPSPDIAVVSTRQRVWNVVTRGEIPNLYVMDSSIFPTSVGANPMQSIYTFAKIFADRFVKGMDAA